MKRVLKTAKRLAISFGMTLLGFIVVILILALVSAVIVWLVSFIPEDMDPRNYTYIIGVILLLVVFILAWKHAYEETR